MCIMSVVAQFPQKLKSMFFEKNFERSGSKEASGVRKKIQKPLILVFEVIVQPPKHIFKNGIFFVF